MVVCGLPDSRPSPKIQIVVGSLSSLSSLSSMDDPRAGTYLGSGQTQIPVHVVTRTPRTDPGTTRFLATIAKGTIHSILLVLDQSEVGGLAWGAVRDTTYFTPDRAKHGENVY